MVQTPNSARRIGLKGSGRTAPIFEARERIGGNDLQLCGRNRRRGLGVVGFVFGFKGLKL